MKLKIYDNNTRFVYNLDEEESKVYDDKKYLTSEGYGPDSIVKRLITIDPDLRNIINSWGIDNPEESFMPYDLRVIDLPDDTIQIELKFYPDMSSVSIDKAKEDGPLSAKEIEKMEKTVFKGMDKFKLVDVGMDGSIVLMYEEPICLFQIANKTKIPVVTFQNGMNACILAECSYNMSKLEKILKKIDGYYSKVYFMPHGVVEKCRALGLDIPTIRRLPR